jgi:hypothetical protein
MADRKISDLTALTTPASGDYLPIVDISEAAAASKNKRITIEELMRGVPNGTAAAPGIAFETDPNTGIYSPGADQLAVATNGAGRLFVDSDGNIGIGGTTTTGWAQKQVVLDAGSGTSASYVLVNDTTGRAGTDGGLLTLSGSDLFLINREAANLIFRTSNAERLRITSAGLVGIGTTSVDAKLHIQGVSGTYPTSIFNHSAIDVEGEVIRIGRTDSTARYHSIYGKQSAINSSNYLQFRVHDGSASSPFTSQSTVMTLTGQGRVGIGVTSPSSLLTAGSAYGGTPNINSAATFQSTTNTYITIGAGTSGDSGLLFADSGDNDVGVVGYNHGSNAMTFIANAAERARIDSSGRLLIGTSSSPSAGDGQYARLVVQGNTNASAAYVAFASSTPATSITSNLVLAYLNFTDNAGNTFGRVECAADANAGTGDYPGRLVFSTTADGASSPTERMRIDSSGRVGIGTTSPSNTLHLSGGNGVGVRIQNTSNLLSAYSTLESSGALQANISSSGFYSWVIGGGEKARLDSSGRLLVGTSSSITAPDAVGTNREGSLQLAGNLLATTIQGNHFFNSSSTGPLYQFTKSNTSTIGSHTIVALNNRLGTFQWSGSDGTNYIPAAQIYAQVDGTPGTNDMPGRLVFSTTADGAASPTEALRIRSDQTACFIGNTGTAGVGVRSVIQATTGRGIVSGEYVFQGGHSGSAGSVGTVTSQIGTDGNVQNTNNSYGAISDAKLKENIVDASLQWDDLKALQVRNYNFKKETGYSTHTQIGLIAQEVELVSPGLVSESPDRDEDGNDLGTVTKSVNYSVLYMKAVKALQEAMERIEQLEAAVTALQQS